MNAPALSITIPSLQMSEDELVRVLESSMYPGAKLDSIKLAIGYCRGNALDPMTKPVHIVPMEVKKAGSRDEYEWRDIIMPGIELYRTKAARTGQYAGIDDAEYGPDVTDDKAVGIAYPAWCRVTVYRIVAGEPRSFSSGRVIWKEAYASAGRGKTEPNRMWKKRAYGQIEKCAEAMALRRAFPEIGADPTVEEMAGKVIDDGVGIDAERQQIAGPRSKSATAEPKAEATQTPDTARTGTEVSTPSTAPSAPASAPQQNGTDKPSTDGMRKTVGNKLKGLAAVRGEDLDALTKRLLHALKADSIDGLTFKQVNAGLDWVEHESQRQPGED